MSTTALSPTRSAKSRVQFLGGNRRAITGSIGEEEDREILRQGEGFSRSGQPRRASPDRNRVLSGGRESGGVNVNRS